MLYFASLETPIRSNFEKHFGVWEEKLKMRTKKTEAISIMNL